MFRTTAWQSVRCSPLLAKRLAFQTGVRVVLSGGSAVLTSAGKTYITRKCSVTEDGMNVGRNRPELGVDRGPGWLRIFQSHCQIILGAAKKCLNLGLLANIQSGDDIVLLNFGKYNSAFVPLVKFVSKCQGTECSNGKYPNERRHRYTALSHGTIPPLRPHSMEIKVLMKANQIRNAPNANAGRISWPLSSRLMSFIIITVTHSVR